jgi:F-type H+-transporting ATPase subunit epsilon
MADERTLTVSVVTPDGSAYEGAARSVVVPAFDGEVGFYPQHAPFLGVLGHGELRVTPAEGSAAQYFYLAGGVVQVADDTVSVLAEVVEPARAVDAHAARKRLDELLATPAEPGQVEQRLDALDDARARIRTAERAARRGQLTAKETLEQPVE